MKARAWVRFAQYTLLVIGLAALGYCALVLVSERLYQAREARRFAEASRLLRGTPSVPGASSQLPEPRDRALIGKLKIPRIGVSVMVVEGVTAGDLRRGAGHIPGTALPGESGNIALAGHRDTFFRALRRIHPDDTVTLSTARHDYRYHVVSTQVVGPRDVKVLDPTAHDTLTLVTCFPFNYVGSAPKRFIVRAERLQGA
ncbi:MAG TPA: class D sortase [Bryobacteraceae bacterium]|nr:class D sortase [Bryobacteraceae bacterium]